MAGQVGVSSRIDASVKYIVRILEVDEHGENRKEERGEIMRAVKQSVLIKKKGAYMCVYVYICVDRL